MEKLMILVIILLSIIPIGSKVWTVENLRTTRYSNGDVIVNILDQSEWNNTTSGAWSYLTNDAKYEIPYGKLYNWFAVSNYRNICPAGWHIPSDPEWTTLLELLGGNSIAGGKLKETGTVHWDDMNAGSTNSSGFTALPGGFRAGPSGPPIWYISGVFWSASALDAENAYCYSLNSYSVQISRIAYLKQYGFSVRCIKDN